MQALREIFTPAKAIDTFNGPLVGLEIEVEGENLVTGIDGWRCERDGSLRGENVEYVFPRPLPWEEGINRVKKLRLKTKMAKSTILNTGYAGIHVHVNVTDLTPIQIWRYAMAYYVVEPLLLEWCGEDRKNNLFCLSLAAAPLPIDLLSKAIQECRYDMLRLDDIRYSALNFKALAEYGSFEFRAMYSTLDEEVIDKWVRMLLELRQFALTDYPVADLLGDLSVKQEAFLKVLMPTTHVYLKDIPNVFDKMLDAVREIQWHVVRFSEANVALSIERRIKEREELAAKHRDGPVKFREQIAPEVMGGRVGNLHAPHHFIQEIIDNEPEIDL